MLGLSGPISSSSGGGSVLTLAEILQRNVSIEWHEGVALVRAVIDRITMSSTSIPELHQVELESSGRVDVTGGSSTDEPVRRLGQLLQATFGRTDPPVQLRLMISQATAPSPAFGSVREFDEVLGYYERPNREASLQALFERASAAPPAQDPVKTTLDSLAPLPTHERPKPVKPPKPPEVRRRQRRFAIAVVVLLLAGAAGVQYMRSLGAVESQQVAEIAAKASDAVGTAVVTGLSKVTETVGLGRLVSDSASNATPAEPVLLPAAPEPTPKTATRGSRAPLEAAAQAIPVQVFDLDVKPSVVSSIGEAPSTTPAPAAETAPSTPNGGEEADMFSPANSDVVPPVGIRPQLPRELPKNINREDLTRIELVVAADGTVETVRLASSPKTVHDRMWLSAVKAWQFQPALKDGRPVRYLKTVWIAPQ